MSREQFNNDLILYNAHNLNDFESYLLDDYGTLEISEYFKEDIYLSLGSSLLKMSSVTLPDDPFAKVVPNKFIKNDHLFVLKNVDKPEVEPYLLKRPRIGPNALPTPPEGYVFLDTGIFQIGTKTSPELELNQDVKSDHLHIQLRESVHSTAICFSSPDSTYPNLVYVHQNDHEKIISPSKLYNKRPSGQGMPLSKVAVEKRWLR